MMSELPELLASLGMGALFAALITGSQALAAGIVVGLLIVLAVIRIARKLNKDICPDCHKPIAYINPNCDHF